MSCFSMLLVLLLRLLLVVSIKTASVTASGPHIADVNILLPPKITHPVEFLLQGTDGCFEWSWDHHDILALLPQYNYTSRCSTSARLKSIAPYSGRKETAVYATDVNTGIVLRCKVYIDMFSRIQIFHSSVKLDLDGLATLRVRAFDSEENVFSSLVGLQFMWYLKPENDGLAHRLVHVPLKDSPQSDCGGFCGDLDIQVKLEDSGVFSDLYVVKGIDLGHEIVSVHLIEPSLGYMEDKIKLTVAEAMSLDPPSPVFVLIGSVFRYNLKVIRENIPSVVSLPSPFHRWSVVNFSVAQVDNKMGEVYTLNLGLTTVIVEDIRVAGHTQTSSLHVVLPGYLVLYISPLSPSGSPSEEVMPSSSTARWYVVSGRQYLIHVKAFPQGPRAHEIFITDRNDIEFHDDLYEFWEILSVSDTVAVKQNSKILKTIANGLGKLTATLTYQTGDDERNEVIKVEQELMVCDQVKFTLSKGSAEPHRILLPWAPGISQELELKVTGGCAMLSSEYKWSSSDMDTVSVSSYGVVQSKNPGKATIKAVSVYDPLNFDEVLIEVSIPSSMVMLQNFPVEVPVGSHIQASVTLKTSDGSVFDRCDAFSSFIKWKTESDSFIIHATKDSHEERILEPPRSLLEPPCAWTKVFASNSGRTMLHATLPMDIQQFDQFTSGFVALTASLQIGAYMPLVLHEASDGNQFGGYWINLTKVETLQQLRNLERLHLVPGAHFDIKLNGGPQRWGHDIEFIETWDTLETVDEKHSYKKDGIQVYRVYTDHGTLYRLKCKEMGTFELVFSRRNIIGSGHPLPAISEAHLVLMCDFPSSIVLIVDETVNSLEAIKSAMQAARSPERIRVNPIRVANSHAIRLSAVGIGHDGTAFGNSSSLQLNWELSNCSELVLAGDAWNSEVTRSSWERFLSLQNTSGPCTVRATVVGNYDIVGRRRFNKAFGSSEDVLTDAVKLHIVPSLRLDPEFSLLFFSNDARINISIPGGSCFLETHINDSRILEVVELPELLRCSQLMLAPKRLGAALVTVHDNGVPTPIAASSVVQVADVDWIKITSGDQISLMEGDYISINFSAGIDDGLVFDSSQYAYMNVRVHIEDLIAEVVEDSFFQSSSEGYVRAPSITILGTNLGSTTLYVSARRHSGDEIMSQSILLEVYAPPRVHPSYIFLVPGASYVLTVIGGPSFGSHVEFSSINDTIAQVHKSSGRVSAMSPGNTTFFATFYQNENITIHRTNGTVKVDIPSSAVLNVQSDQLAVDSKMPIFASLSEGNLFSFYEVCSNYEWHIEDEQILGFHVLDHLHGVNHSVEKFRSINRLDEDVGFLKVLHSRSPGKTQVAVTFRCDFNTTSFNKSGFYNTFVQLMVVPDLPLALGSSYTWILPPHYTSSSLLPIFSRPYTRGDDTSRRHSISYSLLGLEGNCGKTEEVRDDFMLDGGKIKTRAAGTLACIQAKDRSTGRIEVASCVRVAEVAQARILNEDSVVLKLAVESELDLPIKYYDVLGNTFKEAFGVKLVEAETNFPGILKLYDPDDHGNVRVRAISQGKALVRIAFTSDPHKSDYLMISVGAYLYPTNPVLHQGSRLNFGIEDDQALGSWSSANVSILKVNTLTGEAEAVLEGSTEVHYEGPNMKLQTKVTVVKGDLVTVVAPKETLTNSPPFSDKGYIFSVELGDAYDEKYKTIAEGKALIDCRVDPSYIGFALPRGDVVTGKSYCIFFPYGPEYLVQTLPNSLDTRQMMVISVTAMPRGAKNISGSASTFYIGGFSLLEMDPKSPHLTLAGSNSTNLTIVGNTDVRILHDQDRLSVQEVDRKDSTRGRYTVYSVKVREQEGFTDKLIITLPATGQKMEVRITSYPAEQSHTLKSTLLGFIYFLGIPLLVAAIIILLYNCSEHGGIPIPRRRRQPPATGTPPHHGPMVFQSPASATPSSPVQSSPTPRSEHVASPGTPPRPFVDYIRSTIDETPYYSRRNFRRRANDATPPQTF